MHLRRHIIRAWTREEHRLYPPPPPPPRQQVYTWPLLPYHFFMGLPPLQGVGVADTGHGVS